MGERILVHASEVKTQDSVQATPGTSISVKQLFYNIPARRKFLKSDAVEFKHIVEEFKRIALANPRVFFSLHNQENELYHLPKTTQKQRIINLLGKKYDQVLLPVEEEVDEILIKGWVTKPEHAKRRKTDTFLFVNERFIVSHYMHHAIKAAYGDLIDSGSHPPYVLFLTIDPSRVDVNVHPTKQEIKFDNERLIYNYIRVAVRHALGQYSLSPLIDFENAKSQSRLTGASIIEEQQKDSRRLNAFGRGSRSPSSEGWEELYEIAKSSAQPSPLPPQDNIAFDTDSKDAEEETLRNRPALIHNRYIASSIKDGLVLIHKKNALARIFYEELRNHLTHNSAATQQELFPISLSLSPQDALIMEELLEGVQKIGFDIEPFGDDSYIIRGIPVELSEMSISPKDWIESLIEDHKQGYEKNINLQDSIIKKIAIRRARYHKKPLAAEELSRIIDQLFACEIPEFSPDGKRCFTTIGLDELEKRFKG